MTTHNDHHLTETEDAAFDATLKIGGIAMAFVAIVVAALWFFGS